MHFDRSARFYDSIGDTDAMGYSCTGLSQPKAPKAEPVIIDAGQDVTDTFYLVWSPTGATPPSYRHYSHTSAVKEAERLAFEHAGSQFVVLRATDVRLVDPMIRVQLGDMPF